MTSRWLLTFLFVWIMAPAHGQYRVRHYTIKDGLAQGGAYYMLKDSRRYLWFLSQDGLTRFDGTRFVNYYSSKTDPGSGPTGDTGSGLAETPNGDLWFGTEQCLNHYHRATNRFSTVFARDKQGKSTPTLTHVIGADDNRVWFINEAEGLLSLDWRTGKRTLHTAEFRYNPPYDNEYAKLCPSSSEIWLLLPDNGVVVFNYHTGRTRSFFSNRPDNQVGAVKSFSALYTDPDGSVWLADVKADALIALDPRSGHLQTYPLPVPTGSSVVWVIESDGADNLYVATGRDGIRRFDKRQRTWTEHLYHDPFNTNSLAIDAVAELLIDAEGVLWASSDPIALDQFIPDIQQVRHYDVNPIHPPSLGAHNVWQVTEGLNGTVWIGLFQGGIDLFDPKTERILRHFDEKASGRDSLPANTVYMLYVDERGQTWATIGSNFCRYDTQKGVFVSIRPSRSDTLSGDHRIVAMCEAPGGTFFVATWSGLYRYDPVSNHMTLLADAGVRFNRTIYYNPRTRYLYAGRRLRDVVCYQVNGNAVKFRFSALSTLSPQAISPNTDSTQLWVATTNGLHLIRALDGKTVRSWYKKDGLPHNVTYSVLMDRKGLRWISTNRGMAVLNPATGQVRAVRSIEPTEFNNAAFLLTRFGEMYFGSATGLYRFDPMRQTSQAHALSVNLTGLFINDQAVQPDSSLTELHQLVLKPDQRTLTLQFGAVDYFSNGQNQYRYRLMGYDPNWVESGFGTTVRYANLPPDDYMFEVGVADADGNWMNTPRRLAVRVVPPFWRTTWFTGLIGLLASGLVYAGFRTYLYSRLRRQRREFKLQTASQQAERERLARDLHDNIGPDLVALKLQLEATREDVTDESTRQVLSRMIELLNQIITDVRHVSHALTPINLQRNGLSQNLEEFISQLNGRASGCEISFTSTLDYFLTEARQQAFLQIAKELINNAVKHAKASLIDVELHRVGQEIQLTVSDNGKGYDPALNEQFFSGIGLRNIKTIVTQLEGRFIVTKKPTGGMQHGVIIPA